MRRLTAFVHGDVQRAGYRSRVVTIARDLGLKGFIQNLPDGRVKIIAEGGTEGLKRLVKAIKIGNSLIKVDKIDQDYSEPTGEFESFYKLVDEGETDERLDTAAQYLKELVDVTRNGFSDLKGVIIDESQKTRETVRDESQKTRDDLGTVIRDESQKTREGMRSTFGSRFSKIEDDIDQIKNGIGRS